jgi:hypothetical protein
MTLRTQPAVTTGVFGWRNPEPPPNATSLALYGPGGRWDKHQGIEDALYAAGAHEGDGVLVVAVSRFDGALLDRIREAVERVIDESGTWHDARPPSDP